MEIKYGATSIRLENELLDGSIILAPTERQNDFDAESAIRDRIYTELQALLRLKNPKTIAILVEDRTRKNPDLPRVIQRLLQAIRLVCNSQTTVIVAYGTHPRQSDSESEMLYGKENLDAVRLEHHDCRDENRLTEVGKLASGKMLKVNRAAFESEFRIAIGTVEPHTFAGFTGGRKIVLPGIADYETIRQNHSQVALGTLRAGVLADNPIHSQMTEALGLFPLDYSIQIVRDRLGKMAGMYTGDCEDSFEKAIRLCAEINSVKIDTLADAVFVSCGGFPKDKTLYQSMRAITTAARTVKPGGTVVVFAQYSEGVGNAQLQEWLEKPAETLLALKQSEIEVGIHSAYLTARNLRHCEVALYTEMDDELARRLHFRPMRDIDEIGEYLKTKHGSKPVCYFIPDGSQIVIEK